MVKTMNIRSNGELYGTLPEIQNMLKGIMNVKFGWTPDPAFPEN